MRGSSRVIFIAAIALLIAPIAGYSRHTHKSRQTQTEFA